ncbi:MAG: alpha/beta fold hydrolase [Christensenellales bacterium]
MEIYDKKFVELGNGEKYAFIETGKGAPLLLIHGNMSSGVHFSPILPALPKNFIASHPICAASATAATTNPSAA